MRLPPDGSKLPEQEIFPFDASNEPPFMAVVAVPVRTSPCCPTTATGTVTEQPVSKMSTDAASSRPRTRINPPPHSGPYHRSTRVWLFPHKQNRGRENQSPRKVS